MPSRNGLKPSRNGLRLSAVAEQKRAEAERVAEQERIDAEQQKEWRAEQARKEAKQQEHDRKQAVAESCPLSIIGMTLTKDDFGTPQIEIIVGNRKSQPMEAFEVVIEYHDKFGRPVNAFGFGGNGNTILFQEMIGGGQTKRIGKYTLYGLDAAAKFTLTVMRVKMSDGTEWKPPAGFEDVNRKTYVTK